MVSDRMRSDRGGEADPGVMNPQIELSEIREKRFTMKILQVNSVCGVTGTGRIVTDLYDAAVNNGHDCIIAYGEHKF